MAVPSMLAAAQPALPPAAAPPQAPAPAPQGQPGPDAGDFPPGLVLTLTADQMVAAGITQLPQPGTVIMVSGGAKVVKAHASADQNGAVAGLSLEFTDLDLEPDQGSKSAGQSVYGPGAGAPAKAPPVAPAGGANGG